MPLAPPPGPPPTEPLPQAPGTLAKAIETANRLQHNKFQLSLQTPGSFGEIFDQLADEILNISLDNAPNTILGPDGLPLGTEIAVHNALSGRSLVEDDSIAFEPEGLNLKAKGMRRVAGTWSEDVAPRDQVTWTTAEEELTPEEEGLEWANCEGANDDGYGESILDEYLPMGAEEDEDRHIDDFEAEKYLMDHMVGRETLGLQLGRTNSNSSTGTVQRNPKHEDTIATEQGILPSSSTGTVQRNSKQGDTIPAGQSILPNSSIGAVQRSSKQGKIPAEQSILPNCQSNIFRNENLSTPSFPAASMLSGKTGANSSTKSFQTTSRFAEKFGPNYGAGIRLSRDPVADALPWDSMIPDDDDIPIPARRDTSESGNSSRPSAGDGTPVTFRSSNTSLFSNNAHSFSSPSPSPISNRHQSLRIQKPHLKFDEEKLEDKGRSTLPRSASKYTGFDILLQKEGKHGVENGEVLREESSREFDEVMPLPSRQLKKKKSSMRVSRVHFKADFNKCTNNNRPVQVKTSFRKGMRKFSGNVFGGGDEAEKQRPKDETLKIIEEKIKANGLGVSMGMVM